MVQSDVRKFFQCELFSGVTAEMREMGFGAGMGPANIRRNADGRTMSSPVGTGTTATMTIAII
jgi:serine/threonine-protein kinase RsbT